MKKSKFTDQEVKMCEKLHITYKTANLEFIKELYSKTLYIGKTKIMRTHLGGGNVLEQPLSDAEAALMIELAEKIDLYISVREAGLLT